MTSIQADEGFLKLQICLIAGSWQGRMNAVGDVWNPWAMKIRILREGVVTWVHHSPIWITIRHSFKRMFSRLKLSLQHIARENWMFFFSINPVDCFKNRASPLHNSSLFGCATSIRGNLKRQKPWGANVAKLQTSSTPDPISKVRRDQHGAWGGGEWLDGYLLGVWNSQLGGFPPLFWLNWIFGGHLLAYGDFFLQKHYCHVTGRWKTLRILWSRVWVLPCLRATVIIKDDSAFSSGNFQFYDSLPKKLH